MRGDVHFDDVRWIAMAHGNFIEDATVWYVPFRYISRGPNDVKKISKAVQLTLANSKISIQIWKSMPVLRRMNPLLGGAICAQRCWYAVSEYSECRTSGRSREIALIREILLIERDISSYLRIAPRPVLNVAMEYRQNRTYRMRSCSDWLRFGCF